MCKLLNKLVITGLLAAAALAACAPGDEVFTLAPSPEPPTSAPPTLPPASPTPEPTTAPSPNPSTPTPAPGETAAPEIVGEPIPHLTAGQPVSVTEIHMLDATTGWAVGQSVEEASDHILRTSDGGATWRDVTPPEPLDPEAISGEAASAFFLDANIAQVAYADRAFAPSFAPIVVWRTQDGGQTWTASQPLPPPDIFDYFSPSDVVFVDAQTGWLLAHLGVGMSHDYVALYATADGGQTWARVVDPNDIENQQALPQSCYKNGLDFVDAQTGWVAGDCGGVVPGGPFFYKTTDGGRSWSLQELPPPAEAPDVFTNELIYCGAASLDLSTQVGRVIVQCNYAEPVQSRRWLYVTTDGGQTWAARSLPVAYGSVMFIDADVGWSVGADAQSDQPEAQLHQTLDGGQTWSLVRSLGWAGQLDFINAQAGWAVAQAGEAIAFVYTTDGGQRWQELRPQIAP